MSDIKQKELVLSGNVLIVQEYTQFDKGTFFPLMDSTLNFSLHAIYRNLSSIKKCSILLPRNCDNSEVGVLEVFCEKYLENKVKFVMCDYDNSTNISSRIQVVESLNTMINKKTIDPKKFDVILCDYEYMKFNNHNNVVYRFSESYEMFAVMQAQKASQVDTLVFNESQISDLSISSTHFKGFRVADGTIVPLELLSAQFAYYVEQISDSDKEYLGNIFLEHNISFFPFPIKETKYEFDAVYDNARLANQMLLALNPYGDDLSAYKDCIDLSQLKSNKRALYSFILSELDAVDTIQIHSTLVDSYMFDALHIADSCAFINIEQSYIEKYLYGEQ